MKILESLQKQYQNRRINLVCIKNKWAFRTSTNLSKLMNFQTPTQKKSLHNETTTSYNKALSKYTMILLVIIEAYDKKIFADIFLSNTKFALTVSKFFFFENDA